MSLQIYYRLKAWHRARHERKDHHAEPAYKPAAAEPYDANPVVYAAGIACAGQVGERKR
ncbi:hypothetical protein [Parasulfuritortus cantonensis]|uniref:hypothetical protein n=1 Tax=Parasulfuritortus cantonensis TaxID=2528202 RepID=UPI001405161C|nr:hypothetical protein [Parasulfuritortus cantonensis]